MTSVALAEVGGPVPEGASTVELHVHAAADGIAPGLVSTLRRICGPALRVLDEPGPASRGDFVFVGDRAPVLLRGPLGGELVSFLSASVGPTPYVRVDAWTGCPTRVVPLLLERGAIVCTGERLLVSEAVLAQNQRPPCDVDRERLRAFGWFPRSPEVVKALLAEGLGRPRRDFLFVPAMPGDASAQVATWALALGERLIVPEIEQAAFDVIGLVHEVALGRLVQTFLDVQAAQLESRGFVVERLPMMPPTDLVRAPHREESWLGAFSSPTSAVLLELHGRRTALLPRPSSAGFSAGYEAVLSRVLEAWQRRFERAGFEVVFVDDTGVKARGGSLRRLVATFPPA